MLKMIRIKFLLINNYLTFKTYFLGAGSIYMLVISFPIAENKIKWRH